MKTKKRKASPSVLIVLIVAVLLILSVTFAAIFRQTVSVTRTFSASNFSAQSIVKFDGLSDNRMQQYKTAYGVRASLDPSADNYIGKLCAGVQYKGRGVGLIRVRLTEEWSVTKNGVRTVQPYQVEIPYIVTDAYTGTAGNGNQSAWYDNRMNDYCYYYATPVYSSGTSTIDLIEGVDVTSIDTGVLPISTEIQILFEVDAVQVNRYPQYWGLDKLPWAGSSGSVSTGVTSGSDTSLPTLAPAQQGG